MLVSIRHKGLKLLWIRNDASRLPADQVVKIRNILTMLNAAKEVSDMAFPGAALHSLKGPLTGYWSVTVKSNWRIIFRFEKGNVHWVDYIDYH